MTRSGLPRLRCCVCHIHHKCAMTSPTAAREFFETVIQQVCHFKVDVIAGDANAAAYKYCKNQEYQDLCISSVSTMLREMQRELNKGRPFESRLHSDYYNNHSFHINSASDLDCCFMAILSLGKPPAPRIMRTLWSNTTTGHSAISL